MGEERRFTRNLARDDLQDMSAFQQSWGTRRKHGEKSEESRCLASCEGRKIQHGPRRLRDASLCSVSRFGYGPALHRSIFREAALGNWRAGPFRYTLHTVGECADCVLAPASERHRVEAKAEHGHAVLEGLAARLSRGR